MGILPERPSLSDKEFNKLSGYVQTHIGIKMPPTKRLLLESRLRKRLVALGLASYGDYFQFLNSPEGTANERQFFIDAVTTNKTDFFRENDHFEVLVNRVVPEMISRGKKQIRVWSAAASTGEEPYTLALYLEELRKKRGDFDFSVLGTDISTQVLGVAREGVYAAAKLEPIPQFLRTRYFEVVKKEESYRVCRTLKDKVKLGRLNLLNASYNLPHSFDVIFCRNVFIYFPSEKQQQITNRLIKYMNPGAYLFFGHSESMAGLRKDLQSQGAAVYTLGNKR